MALTASAVRDVERLLNQVTQLRHYNGLGAHRWNHYVENELKEIGSDARRAAEQALADDNPLGQRVAELDSQKRIMDLCFEAYVECLQTITTPPNVTFMQELWEQVARLLARWRRTADSQRAAMAELQADVAELKSSNKALKKQVRNLTRQADGLMHDVSAFMDQAAHQPAAAAEAAPLPAIAASAPGSRHPSRPSSRGAVSDRERPRAASASAARSLRETSALELIPGARTQRLDLAEGDAGAGTSNVDNPAELRPMGWRARTAMEGLRSHTPASDFASMVSSRASTPGPFHRAWQGSAADHQHSRAETPIIRLRQAQQKLEQQQRQQKQQQQQQQEVAGGRLGASPQLAPVMPGAAPAAAVTPPQSAYRPAATAPPAGDSRFTTPRQLDPGQTASQAASQRSSGAPLPGSFDAWRLRSSRKTPSPAPEPEPVSVPAVSSNVNKSPLRLKVPSKRSEQARVQATSKWLQTLAASSAGPSPARPGPRARPVPINLGEALAAMAVASPAASVAAGRRAAAQAEAAPPPAPTVTLSPEALSRHARLSAEASGQGASAGEPAGIAVVRQWEVPSEAEAHSPTTLHSSSPSQQQQHHHQQQQQQQQQQQHRHPELRPGQPRAVRALWQAPTQLQPVGTAHPLAGAGSAPAALQSSPEASDSVLLGSGPPTARESSVRSSRRADSPLTPCSPEQPSLASERRGVLVGAGELSPQQRGRFAAPRQEGRQRQQRDAAVATADDWPTSTAASTAATPPSPAAYPGASSPLTSPLHTSPAAAAAAAAVARAAQAPKGTPKAAKQVRQPAAPAQAGRVKDEHVDQSTDQLGMMTLLGSPPHALHTLSPIQEESAGAAGAGLVGVAAGAMWPAPGDQLSSHQHLQAMHSPPAAAAAAAAAVVRTASGSPSSGAGDGGRIGALRARMAAVQARGASPEDMAALLPWRALSPQATAVPQQAHAQQADTVQVALQDAHSRRDVPARDKQGRDASAKVQSPAKPSAMEGSPSRRQLGGRGESDTRQPDAQHQPMLQQQQQRRRWQQQEEQQLSSSVDEPIPSFSPAPSPSAADWRRGSSWADVQPPDNTAPNPVTQQPAPALARRAPAAAAHTAPAAPPLRPLPVAAPQTEIQPAPLEDESEEGASPWDGQMAVVGRGALPLSASTPDGVLSLRELRAIIRDVFRSKVEADTQCVRRRLPRQTLAQHLQEYIGARTGSKEQAERAHSMLQAGIAAHRAKEPEVALFDKVLRNQIDEEFFLSHSHTREAALATALSALQTLLNAPAAEVARRKVGSSEALSQQECAHVLAACCRVGGLQEGEALESLAAFVADWVERHCEAGRLSLPSLIDALLLYRLRQREAALTHVVSAFRSVDSDDSGVLGSSGFRSFCRRLNVDMPQAEVDELFRELDAGGHGRVTFSAIAACLMQALADVEAGEQEAAAVAM